MPEFIFMLTRNDQTIVDAREVFAQLGGLGLHHVGFKDIGLPAGELVELAADIRRRQSAVHLEVVSETEAATLASARMAVELAPDYLLGGTLIEEVLEIIVGTPIKSSLMSARSSAIRACSGEASLAYAMTRGGPRRSGPTGSTCSHIALTATFRSSLPQYATPSPCPCSAQARSRRRSRSAS